MRTRKASAEVTLNGVDIMKSGMVTSVAYSDIASGEVDVLDIGFSDRAGQWIGEHMPQIGSAMTLKIKVSDWEAEGDNRALWCGTFILDSLDFSGPPVSGRLSAVSSPAESGFMATERTKTWKNVTIKEIAAEIAGRAGVVPCWDAEGFDFQLSSIEQSGQTDSDFLMQLCDSYGLSLKIYSKKIVLFDRETYKAKPAVKTLGSSELLSWSYKSDIAGSYTGGELAYTDPKSGKDITAKVGEGSRILKISGRADNKADAERKIEAAVAKANHGKESMTATIMGDAMLCAGQCVTIAELGKLSGKYYIDSIRHQIGGGYKMQLELAAVR